MLSSLGNAKEGKCELFYHPANFVCGKPCGIKNKTGVLLSTIH